MKRVAASHKVSGARGEGKAPVECRGRIRVRKRGRRDVSVELYGELDVAAADSLREILGWASDSRNSVAVDLSGVTFLDSSCLRELVVYQRLRPGRVALCDPSPQVDLSVAACGVEAWIHFRPAASRRGQADGGRSAPGEGRGCW